MEARLARQGANETERRHGGYTNEMKAERPKLRESIKLLWTLARLARDL
jgi:hypothetical protein